MIGVPSGACTVSGMPWKARKYRAAVSRSMRRRSVMASVSSVGGPGTSAHPPPATAGTAGADLGHDYFLPFFLDFLSFFLSFFFAMVASLRRPRPSLGMRRA
ncbi:hypothetical protein GCM10009869_00970 [Amnibacterium kyonggiense]